VPDHRDALVPRRHAMRLLAGEVEVGSDGVLRGWLPVDERVLSSSGNPRLAAVGMFADMLGGRWSMPLAGQAWPVTADMTVHLLATGGREPLELEARTLRRGRRTMVAEMAITAAGRPAGLATLSFALVERPERAVGVDLSDLDHVRTGTALPDDEPPAGAYMDELGLVVEEPGVVHVALRPELANVGGHLHGGVHAAIIDEASTSLGRHLFGGPAEALDLHLAYLRPGVDGPFRAVARPVGGAGGGRLAAEVQVLDRHERACSHATVTVVAA
jgi:uncharacterized protein (TIGR00369 family)